MGVEYLPRKTAGKSEVIKAGGDEFRVTWMASENFSDASWQTNWVIEGNGKVSTEAGRLTVRRLEKVTSNSTLWWKPLLPTNVLIRFKAVAIEPSQDNMGNLNLFLHARELHGSPLRFGRSGKYSEYHELPNYIVTFVRTGGKAGEAGWSRLRRDPGFNMLSEAKEQVEIGKEYLFLLVCENGRVRFYLNGKKLHDITDPQPLPGGNFGLRTWNSNVAWDDLAVGQLEK